jgi:hypothetical protein
MVKTITYKNENNNENKKEKNRILKNYLKDMSLYELYQYMK